MDSNTPQLRPSETESRSMDSTTPQLRPSETESRRIDSTTQPNLNLQAEPYSWTSTATVRREDGTIQLPPNFNLLQEVESMQSPLGLKFTITPEFLTKYWSWRLERATGKPVAVGQPLENKASTIPATSISIGPSYRKESIREDHLTLKLYFAKKKLIWEFLEGPLKKKIEISWSDITAIHAHIPDHQPGILQIKLGNKPLFYRETSPIALKHTLWEETTDFTHALAASRYRIHEAKFAPGVLEAHYPKLLLSDRRLLELSKNPFPPYPNPNPNPNPTQQQQQGVSSTTAPCLPVNNPTPSNSTPPSQSQSQSHDHLNPMPPIPFTVGVGESSFHMQGERSRYANHQSQTPLLMPSQQQLPFSFTGVEQSLPFYMQGESSPYSTSTVNNPTPSTPASQCMGESSRNANQYPTPLLMPQQPPFSLTGVEQSLLYNNPTPLAASQYLNPAMTAVVSSPRIGERSIFYMEGESSSSRNADPYLQTTPLVLLGDDHSTARAALESNIYGGEQWQELGSNIYGGEQWQDLGSNNYFGTGVTEDPEQPWPELDGDGNTGNDPMDLYSIIRSANINRRPT